LDHIHPVTVPFIVSLFPLAYAAFPWCADSGADRLNPHAITAKNTNLLFKGNLLVPARNLVDRLA